MIGTALRRTSSALNPSLIPWHAAWWTSDPLQSPPSNGARVSSWRDLSGNGRDLAQATSTLQPAYQAQDTNVGRHPTIRGAYGTYLATGAFTGVPQPISVVLVGSIYTNQWNTAATGGVAFDGVLAAQNVLYSNTSNGGQAGRIETGVTSSIFCTRDARPHVWVARNGASAAILKDGVSQATGNTGTSSPTAWTVGGLNGSYPLYSSWGSWAFVGVYAGDVTAHPNWSTFHASLLDYYQVAAQRALVVADGDSRQTCYFGTGYGPAADDWLSQLGGSLTGVCSTVNQGVPSQLQQTQTANGAAKIDPLYSAGNTTNVVVTNGGVNDLPTRTDVQIEGDIQTYCSARQAAGWKVIVCTIPPALTVTGANETKRVAVNSWIRSNYGSWADKLADLDNDARLQNPSDTTYFDTQGVHYTRAGHGVVRDLIATQLATLGVT